MKIIKGIVCVTSWSDSHQTYHALFGKNCGPGRQHYQNLNSNNLTPFDEIDEARQAFEQLRRRKDIQPTGLCRLTMKLAENLEEGESLKNEKALIAVESLVDHESGKSRWDSVSLYGRRVKGCMGFDSRSELCDNGLLPYIEEKWKAYDYFSGPKVIIRTAYEQARYAACEIIRQNFSFATISTFKLRKLKFQNGKKN